MITHYPGNMDYGEKVTGRKTVSGTVSEGQLIQTVEADVTLKLITSNLLKNRTMLKTLLYIFFFTNMLELFQCVSLCTKLNVPVVE